MREWLQVLKAADTAARWHVHRRRKGPAEEPYSKNASRYLPAVPQKIIENDIIRGPLDPDNSPRHVDETRRYIQDFNRLDEETTSARELYDRMLALYPDRINPGSLWGSANAAKTPRQAKASP